jgi:tyrosine-protein kinase Etk/Wzc
MMNPESPDMATQNAPQATLPDDDVHLLDYVFVLAKHSRLIVYTTAVVTLLMIALLLTLPNEYTAKARILPPQQNLTLVAQLLDTLGGGTSPASSSAGALGGGLASMLGLKSPGDLYVGIMMGDTIYDHIIERFDLQKIYYPQNGFFGKPCREDVRQKLEKKSKIDVGKDGIITIEVTDREPKRAAALANAFGEELDKLLQGMSSRAAREQLAFLEKERQKANLNLVKAEEAVKGFSESNNVLIMQDQVKGMIEYIATLRANIDAKEVQLQVLRQRAAPSNDEVVRLETELKGLKDKLRETEGQSGQTQLGDLRIPTSQVPALGLEYLRLYREAKFQDLLYQLFSKLVEMAHLDEVRDSAVLQIVDQATPPGKKSKPKRLLITLVVFVGTFFIMGFVAFALEHWHSAPYSDEEALRVQQIKEYSGQCRQDIRRMLSRLKRKPPRG